MHNIYFLYGAVCSVRVILGMQNYWMKYYAYFIAVPARMKWQI